MNLRGIIAVGINATLVLSGPGALAGTETAGAALNALRITIIADDGAGVASSGVPVVGIDEPGGPSPARAAACGSGRRVTPPRPTSPAWAAEGVGTGGWS
ncbi:MAG: hypothetical protein LW650_03810 [Planctomycetaceae bacterium]|nr:hypothetical protein [Phycisphaerales bacterium]MCE2652638.1 hypothetical protein [Planctomycetaceae bacterium]